MTQFDFGRPDNGVIQMAYIVEDIGTAMSWTRELNVGPWFLLEHFTGVIRRLPRHSWSPAGHGRTDRGR
jgi:hypothetical protein